MFSDLLDKHAPITEIKLKGNNLPYITLEMKRLIRTRDHLKKKRISQDPNIFTRLFDKLGTK